MILQHWHEGVWQGERTAAEKPVLPCCFPLHSWFSGLSAEHVNYIGRVGRVMQEDTNKPELPFSQ